MMKNPSALPCTLAAALALVAAACSPDRVPSVAEYAVVGRKIDLANTVIYNRTPLHLCESEHCIIKAELNAPFVSQKIDYADGTSEILHRKGRGPNEYASLSIKGVDSLGRFYATTNRPGSVIEFSPSGEVLKTVSLDAAPLSLTRLGDCYVAYGDLRQPDAMFVVCDTLGARLSAFGSYPDDGVACENRYKMLAYQGFLISEASKSRIAHLSREGDFFAIYDLKNPAAPEPVFALHDNLPDYRPNGDVLGVKYNVHKFRYLSVCSTAERIFVLRFDAPAEALADKDRTRLFQSRRIAVYDWDGNRLCDLLTDIPVSEICVDRAGRNLFALCTDDGGDLALCSFELPPI